MRPALTAGGAGDERHFPDEIGHAATYFLSETMRLIALLTDGPDRQLPTMSARTVSAPTAMR